MIFLCRQHIVGGSLLKLAEEKLITLFSRRDIDAEVLLQSLQRDLHLCFSSHDYSLETPAHQVGVNPIGLVEVMQLHHQAELSPWQ